MDQDKFLSTTCENKVGEMLIGCDVSGTSTLKASDVLSAFVQADLKQTKLLLMEKRNPSTDFCCWNYIEQNQLTDRVDYKPYYRSNSLSKESQRCDVWIDKHIHADVLTPEHIRQTIARHEPGTTSVIGDGHQHVLLFTAFHPYKKEGNSVYTMQFLNYLRELGIVVHLVYYDYQKDSVTANMRSAAARDYQHYHEISVESKLVGHNQDGLNVHVDDWCGCEAVEFVETLCDRFDFTSCFVNYAFYSGIFEAVGDKTQKILLCHDKFANRNQRMLEQGYPHSGWMSITEGGELQGCQRADLLVAIQEQEGAYFRELTRGKKKVLVVPPLFNKNYIGKRADGEKLRIGYFGSKNFVNETNLAELIRHVNDDTVAGQHCEFIVAGGTSEDLDDFLSDRDKQFGNIKCLGQLDDLADFFAQCDVIVNPDRGGTGMKLKTVEAMAHGLAVVCTKAGAAGIVTPSRFHAAENIAAAAHLLREVVDDRSRVAELQQLSCQIYDDLYSDCQGSMAQTMLLDKPLKQIQPPATSQIRDDEKSDEIDCHQPTTIPIANDTNNANLISVIIPFYGVEEFIAECIESTIAQTYQNIEIILVDDCSPDGSRAIAQQFCERDSRVRMITHEKNQGLGPARNTATREAVGKYLFFLDSDDLLKPDALEILYNKAISQDAQIVVGSSDELLPDGSITDFDRRFDKGDPTVLGWREGNEAFAGSFQHPDTKYIPVRAWGTLIDRITFIQSGLEYPPVEHEDFAVTPFLYSYFGSVLYVPEICVLYRVRESSLSRHGWDLGRLQRQSQLWKIIADNCRQYGLQEYLGITAMTFCGHLLWKIDNYGCQAEDLDAIFDVVYPLVADMESCPRFERHRIFWMVETAKRIVCRYDGELHHSRFNQISASFGAATMAEHYQSLLNQ